ncbi:MAG: formate dehydrogenase subunit gamma [Candidatus Acidiferrum sp.]
MSHAEQAVPPGSVLRYNFKERLTHWMTAISYIYLLMTGLAFWSPWLFWLAVILGGGQVSRMLHPWVGLIFTIGVLMLFGMWAAQMHVDENDKNWFRSVGHYVRNEDEQMPPAGRYNAGQKSLFWGFVVCMVLLLLSGLVLWSPQYFPWHSLIAMRIAILIHVLSALLTIGLFLIHVYMGVFAERGALDSMVHGDVSLHFVRRYHPGWYEEITGQPASPKK